MNICASKLLLIAFLCMSTIVNAQTIEVTVNEMGGLESALKVIHSAEEIAAITDLKVTTTTSVYLGSADFTFLNSLSKLAYLDLGDASVTSQDTRTDNSFPRSVFQDNQSIKSIVFPKTLINLNRSSFANSSLTGTITLPVSVQSVAEYDMIFGGSENITEFVVEEGNTKLKAIDGILYTADEKTLLVYPYGREGNTFRIPEGVTTIGTSAFGWNHQLEEITLSSTVTTLPQQDKIINNSTKVKAIHVAEGNETYGSTNGFLVELATGTLMAFPPANTDETIIIDGSIVKIIPQGYFAMAVANLKNIIFTEGVEEIGYIAFKIGSVNGQPITSVLEYVELPSTIKKINGEAFVGNKNLLQVICKATTPPTLAGSQIFREANGTSARLGVPAESLNAYKNSSWNRSIVGNEGINAFPADQMRAYSAITMVDGICTQSVSVSGFLVNIQAGEAPEKKAFSRWESTPTVTFSNNKTSSTSFTMPEEDVTITAIFANKMPYTIQNAITESGIAAIGSAVTIEAEPTQGDKIFRYWQIVEGERLVIENPQAVSTSFTMIDGQVTVSAIYQSAYMINVTDGSAPFDAFEGDIVTIKASTKINKEFASWTTDTPGVEFADAAQVTTTFVMPASEVNIAATYKDVTSIDEIKGSSPVLYPNPATDYIQLANAENTAYIIYNIAGTPMIKGITGGEAINVSELNKGIYLFEANGKTARFIKK